MRQVRLTACKSGMPKPNGTPPKCVNCGRSSPGQFYRLSFISSSSSSSSTTTTTTTTQSLISVAIVRHEAYHTGLPVQASSLQSSQAAGVTSPPHTTWTQTAYQPPTTTDPQSLSSLLDSAKSFLSKFNIQNLCYTLRSLVLRL